MDYKLLKEDDESVLSRKVVLHLKDGWKLYGSPSMSAEKEPNWDYNEVYYIQAVIKEDSKPND